MHLPQQLSPWTEPVRLAAATGMRSTLGPAALAERRGSDGQAILKLLAFAELVADKLPFIPSRTAWPVLTERALAGAFVGYACMKPRSQRDQVLGAVVGAGVAVLVAELAARGREALKRRLKVPYAVSGIAEDAIALQLARH